MRPFAHASRLFLFLLVAALFTPQARAGCSAQLSNVSLVGSTLTATATGGGGTCGSTEVTLNTSVGEFGRKVCPAGGECSVTASLNVSCFLTGPMAVYAFTRCHNSVSNQNGDKACILETQVSPTTVVQINTKPTVSVSATRLDPLRNKFKLDVNYSFPNTIIPASRRLIVRAVDVGGLGEASVADVAAQSGTWSPEFEFACWLTGPLDIEVIAVACGANEADPLHSSRATVRVNIDSTPRVRNVQFIQGADGNSKIKGDYEFHGTSFNTVSLLIDGVIQQTWNPSGASGSLTYPEAPNQFFDSSCLVGTHTITFRARACNDGHPSHAAEASTTFVASSKPTVAVSTSGLGSNGQYTASIQYTFPNTKSPLQRRINLYQDGVLVYAFGEVPCGPGAECLQSSGVVQTTLAGCHEILAVAIACGRGNDPNFTATSTTQAPDELCKRDRDSCEKPGRPVNYGSGDVSLDLPLFHVSQTPLPLSFGLAYHSSRPAFPSLAGEIAPGWTHTFNQTLRMLDETHLYGVDESGRERFYGGSGGNYVSTSPSDVYEVVTRVGAELRLRDLSGTVRAFDAATGHWLSTTDLWNNKILASWDGSGNLASVTDSEGRSIMIVATGARIERMTLSNGAVWQFQYSGGNLSAIFDPLHTGAVAWRTFVYQNNSRNEPRLLTAMRDDGGALVEGHAYDATDRGITSFLENNRELVTLEYDQPSAGQTRVTHKIDDQKSQTTIFTLVYLGGRYRATRIDGGCGSCGIFSDSEQREYDSRGNMVRVVAADGSVTLRTFDASGRVLSRTEAAGTPIQKTVSFEYGVANWPSFVTKITEPASIGPRVTTHQWTGLDSVPAGKSTLTTTVSGEIGPPGNITYTTTSSFDDRHRLISTDGPRTDVKDASAITWYADNDPNPDRRGRMSSVTNAVGLTATWDNYDLYGTPRARRDANGVLTTVVTDLIGRTTATTSEPVPGVPAEAVPYTNTWQFDSRGRLAETVSAAGHRVRSSYENGTNLLIDTTVLDSSGNERERRHLTRNVIGDIVREELQSCGTPAPVCGSWTTARTKNYEFDTHNRRTQIIHADNSRKIFTYDAMGRPLTEQDETHSAPNTAYAYDARGHLTTVTSTLGSGTAVTQYEYDVAGKMVTLVDPNGNATHFEYDDFGRLFSTDSPVTGLTTTDYDEGGNVRTTSHANGSHTALTWDAANRLVEQESFGPVTRPVPGRPGVRTGEIVHWFYDQSLEKVLAGASFRLGRPASMVDPTGTTTWTYDRRGLIVGERRTIDQAGYSMSFGYDADGNRARIDYPSGRTVNYTFDYAGRPYSAASGPTSIVSSASYLPFGPVRQLVFGNGTTQTMNFDNRYQIVQNKLDGTSGTLADYAYTHDAAGNVQSIHDSIDPAWNRDFGYDDLHRLVRADTGAGLWGQGAYQYDAMGNMLSLSLGASRNATFHYAGTTPLLTSVTENGETGEVAYDASGNEIGAGDSSFAYSPRNKLMSTGGNVYGYDGRGLRTTTTVGEETVLRVSLSPASLTAGASAAVTISLANPAPAKGLAVALSADSTAVRVPATIRIPAGKTTATVHVVAQAVRKATPVTITAAARQERASMRLMVRPAAIVPVAFMKEQP